MIEDPKEHKYIFNLLILPKEDVVLVSILGKFGEILKEGPLFIG